MWSSELKNVGKLVKQAVQPVNVLQGENHFYSLPFGQAEAAFTSPDIILTSPKNFLTSRIDFTVPLLLEFLKKHHLPIGQVKNRID